MTLLSGYFDESGTHGPSNATVIAGWLGTVDDWCEIEADWLAATQRDKLFHYTDCIRHRNAYAGWTVAESAAHISNLASILERSKLRSVVASYRGNWGEALAQIPRLKGRFPDAYSFCFELCMQTMMHYSKSHWGQQPVGLVFERQTEYAPRALTTWDIYKYNNEWPGLASFTYGDPNHIFELQAADMIAYEARQLTLEGDTAAFGKWPLLAALKRRDVVCDGPALDVGGFYDLGGVRDMLEKLPSSPLKMPPWLAT